MFGKKIYYIIIIIFILMPVILLAQVNDGSLWQQSYLIWKKRQQEVENFNKEKVDLKKNELKIKKLSLYSNTINSILKTIILFLENIENKINNLQLNDEIKNNYLGETVSLIENLKKYEQEVKEVNSLNDLAVVISEVNKQQFEIQRVSKQAVGRLNVEQWQNLYNGFFLYLTDTEKKIKLLDDQKYNKIKLEKKILTAKNYLDKFSRELIIAKQAFNSTTTVNNSEQVYAEGIKSLRQMSKYLFLVKNILLEIRSIINPVTNINIEDNNKTPVTSTAIIN